MSNRGLRSQGGAAAGLSPWQLVWLIVTTISIEDSTVIDHYLASSAGIDSWIAILAWAPLGLLAAWAIASLVRRHRGLDLVALLRAHLGPAVYVLAPLYVVLFVADATLAARTFAVVAHLLGQEQLVPVGAFLIPIIGLALLGAWLGIEVTARINALLLLLVDIPLGVILTVFSTNHESLARLLPILVEGWAPIGTLMLLMVGKTGEFVAMLVYAPAVEGPSRLPRTTVIATGWLILFALGHSIGPVLTFGHSVVDIAWPSYSQIRSIEFGRFIENLSVAAVVLWLHGFWAETTLFLDAAARTAASLLGMKGHRVLLPWFALGILGLCYLIAPGDSNVLLERRMLDQYGYLAMGVIVPLLLLGISHLRGSANERKAERTPRAERRMLIR